MTDREQIDFLAEKVMGWRRYLPNSGQGWELPDGTVIWAWNPIEDRNHAAQVLEWIAGLGLQRDVIRMLIAGSVCTADREFKLLAATPRQICDAARRAYESQG